jgi:hypothetical protein
MTVHIYCGVWLSALEILESKRRYARTNDEEAAFQAYGLSFVFTADRRNMATVIFT